MAITRVKLSASTNGQAILLSTGAPTTIHTSTTAASTSDEVHVWVINNQTSTTSMSVFFGSTGAVNEIKMEIPAKSGPYLCVPGFFIASGLVVSAVAQNSAMAVYGFVNRLTTGA